MKLPRRPLSTLAMQHSWRTTGRALRKLPLLRLRRAGGGVAWGRLSLLWRQRAVIQDIFTPARRAQASIANSWLTQVHLNFSVSRTELHKTARHHLSVLPGAAVQPSTASPLAMRSGPAIVTVNQTSHHHARHVATGMHWRVTRTALAANAHQPARMRVPGDAAAKHDVAPNVTVLGTIRESRLSVRQMVVSKSQAAAIKPVLLLGRAAAPRGAHPVTAAAAIWQQHTPDLVWRKVPDTASTTARYERGSLSDVDAANASDPVRAASPKAPAAVPSVAAIAAQLRAAPVDPVLADRLALEVIRRVERSMRIERERRGL